MARCQVISIYYADNNWGGVGADWIEQPTVCSCHVSSVHAFFQGTWAPWTTSFEVKCWDMLMPELGGLGPKRVPGSIWSIRMLNDCDVCCDDHPDPRSKWSILIILVSSWCGSLGNRVMNLCIETGLRSTLIIYPCNIDNPQRSKPYAAYDGKLL